MSLHYTFTKPSRPGMYWYLESEDSDAQIVRAFQDDDKHWCVQYDELHRHPSTTPWTDIDHDDGIGTDWVENWKGQYAGPILVPTPPDIDSWSTHE